MSNRVRIALGLCVSALSLGISSQVFAQDAADCSTLDTQEARQACIAERSPIAASGEAGTTSAAADEIVVTGSRIRRSEFNSPDPITIINPNLGLKQGQIETVDLINSSPIAAGSVQITSAISTNYVTNGGADAQTVSLRGLGAERTLVLLNGRRAGPAGVRGGVSSFDLNVLPSSIVDSIEILKTGASSIYGSDAVAGVVNIKTKTDTDGIEFRGFTSVPTRSAGETYNLTATFGKTFERGHFLITADYFRRNNLQRRDRTALYCTEEFLKFENGQRADIRDPRTGQPACNGVIGNLILTSNDFTGPGFSQGLLAPNGRQLFLGQYAVGSELIGVGIPINGLRPGVVAPANFFGLNFDGPSTGAINQFFKEEQNSDVLSKLNRYTIFSDASYNLTDSIELYGEFLYNKRKTYTNGFAQVSTFQFTGDSDLPFFFCAPTDFNCRDTDAGDPFNNEFAGNFLLRPLVVVKADSGTDVDYYRGVFGVRGEFGDGFLSKWNWDVYGQYSRSEGRYFQDATLADSIFTQDFRTRSCTGLVTPVVGQPCINIDWTDPRVLRGDFNAAERAFLFVRDVGNTTFEQMSGEATLSGKLFALPAGDVGLALGTQIRRDKINDVPGENSQAGNLYNLTSAGITSGRTITKEVFGELEVPLIHDTPLIQNFTLSGAARHTKVDATRRDGATDSFSDTTWKAGFNWEVTDWLRFRGSWGTSFRAPALFELFLENQTGFQNQQDIDVCINTAQRLAQGSITQRIFDNCAASGIPSNFQGATGGVTVTSGGGLGTLKPETSTAKTVSAILTPKGWFWSGGRASLAVDYFDIDVQDEITTLGASSIVIGCYNSEFFPNEPLCDNIVRAPAGATEALNITDIRDTYININQQRNKGIDVTARFIQDLGELGTISLLAQMTWQLKDKLKLFEGTEVQLNGTVGDPRWVGDFNITWEKGGTSIFYGLDVVGAADNRENLVDEQGALCRTSVFRPGGSFCPDVSVPAVFYHSTSITQEVGDKFSITLGVSNLLDRKPPRVSTVFNGGIGVLGRTPIFGSQYDYLGRRVFVSVNGAF